MTESQMQLREFEALPQPSSCRLTDFDEAEVRPGIVSGTYILIVRGTKPYLNMEVNLTPLVYIRQPEYWGIEVIGCLRGGIGLAAPTAPYIASLGLNGTIGTQGIEVIGATRSEKISVPPAASGDFAVFLTKELMDSIPKVSGSGATADPAEQHNQYVLPTASQLASWRAVFQGLLAGAWGPAHLQARMISSTYNVVQFLDTPTGRTYYVLMEGVPGQIPDPANHPSGVTITDPADPTRRGWGTYVFAAQPQRALSLSAPHPFDDLETEVEAVEAFLALGARTLLIAGTDRDQNTAEAPCKRSSRPFLEADVSHTAESVFQMAFEEIYSSDASTWHLQFHGNASTARGCEDVDVFLSNGVEAAPAKLHTLAENIAAESRAKAPGGPILMVDVYDAPDDCILRGTDNMQMRFASGRPHASICLGKDPEEPSRFIHVEQSRDARRAFPTDPSATPGRNRGVVVAGILATFP